MRPVDVNDGAEVVQLVEAGKVKRLPDAPLHRLTVPHEAVGPVRRLHQALLVKFNQKK